MKNKQYLSDRINILRVMNTLYLTVLIIYYVINYHVFSHTSLWYGMFVLIYYMTIIYEYRLASAYKKVNDEKTALLDNANEAFALFEAVKDKNGLIIDYKLVNVNGAYLRMVDHQLDEIISKNLSEIYPVSAAAWASIFNQVLNQQDRCSSTLYDGDLNMYVDCSAFTVNDRQVAVLFIDVTERVLHEQNMKATMERIKQINGLKSQFLKDVNHRVRTPLNGMMGMIQLIDCSNLPKDDAEAFHAMKGEMKNFRNIINQISEYVEVQDMKVKLSANNINTVIMQIVEDFELNRKSVKLHFLKGQHSNQYFDRKIFTTVFMELILNAIKYSPNTPVDVYIVHHIDDDKRSQHISVSVKDYGIGIPKDRVALIFNEMYHHDFINIYRNECETSLPICKQMMLLMGGDLLVESEVDKGSEFTLILPVFDQDLRKN